MEKKSFKTRRQLIRKKIQPKVPTLEKKVLKKGAEKNENGFVR